MHAWQRRGMLLMRQRMVSWGISSQIWTRASLSSWTVWGATWWRRMDRNIMSQRCSIGFRSGEREPIQWYQFLHPPGTACILSPHEVGIVVHQEEPRTHCTSIESDNVSKDIIPIPNGSQGATRGLESGPQATLMKCVSDCLVRDIHTIGLLEVIL